MLVFNWLPSGSFFIFMARAFENPEELGVAKELIRQLKEVGDTKSERRKSYEEIKTSLNEELKYRKPNKLESENKFAPNPLKQFGDRKWLH